MGQMDDENVAHLVGFIRGSRRGFSREERESKGGAEGGMLYKVSG
jgi:hypothetical protein